MTSGAIRGWCPSLHEPMATGDGLLVRVKPPLGRISAAAARALAAAARAHGNGAIELTGRGALQFRGMDAASAPRFAAAAVALGLAVADAAGERRRSVLVSPLAGLDSAVAPETAAVAASLEAALLRAEALAALPAKFGFAVDGGGALPLGGQADVSLVLRAGRCLLVPAGAREAGVVEPAQAAAAALRLAEAFLARAAGERRMRGLVAARGAASVLDAAGLPAVPFAPAPEGVPIGRLPGGFGAGLPFGALDAAVLAGLAACAGDAGLRLTPWRSVIVAGLTAPDALDALGLVTDPADPRLSVAACPGWPGCASASVETRRWAARLRPPPGTTVHVSGCDKGCAHPGAATLTFVGRDGRYDLVRYGRAADAVAGRGLAPAAMIGVR